LKIKSKLSKFQDETSQKKIKEKKIF